MSRGDAACVPAVVLAAGTGFRLNAGKPAPKCLAPIRGRPLLGWIADGLVAAGIRTIHIVLGSRAELIEREVQALGVDAEIRTTRCGDWERGNGRSAAHAERVIGDAERFLLLMGDHLVAAAHIASVLQVPAAIGENSVLATDRVASHTLDIDDATKVLINEADGRIMEIGKSLSAYNGIDTGVFSMSRAIFAALERASAAGDSSLTGGNRILAAEHLLFSQPIENMPWQDVDTPADLRAAENLAEAIANVRRPSDSGRP